MHIEYTVSKKQFYASLINIVEVLKKTKHSIDQCELDRNMHFFSENLWYRLEDPCDLNLQLGLNAMESVYWFDIGKTAEIYSKINEQRLSEIARTIFVPNNTSVTVLGAVSKITKKEIRRIIQEGLGVDYNAEN
jgi:predicted Zn-dependent peptidase